MFELLPVIGGAALGLALPTPLTRSWRTLGMTAAWIIGAFASAISGELAHSPLFLFVDTGIALISAAASRLLVTIGTRNWRRGAPTRTG